MCWLGPPPDGDDVAVDRTAFESCMSVLRQALSVVMQQAQTIDRLTRPNFIHVDEEEKKEDSCQSK